jgi:hypothetical protein
VRPGQEPLEDRRPAGAERGVRDVGVLAADRPLVGVELAGGRAEDGEVDVDEQAGVGVVRRGVVAGGQDQTGNRRDPLRRDAGGRQLRRRQVGRAFFVVAAGRVVDGVVEQSASSAASGSAKSPRHASNSRRHARTWASVW